MPTARASAMLGAPKKEVDVNTGSAIHGDMVVVGVNGGATGRGALRWALQYAKRTGSHVRAVRAWHVPTADQVVAELPDLDVAPSVVLPWAALFNKGFTVGFGSTHDRRYTTHLRDLIISGRARPGQVVTHHESLENAPSIYDRFDRRVDGIVKAVFHH